MHDLKLPCVIGVWDWEQKITQTLMMDIDLAVNAKIAAKSDDLEDALNYLAVANRLMAHAQSRSFNLIETLAEELAELVMQEFDIPWVRIKLDKGSAVKQVKSVGVIIERGEKTV